MLAVKGEVLAILLVLSGVHAGLDLGLALRGVVLAVQGELLAGLMSRLHCWGGASSTGCLQFGCGASCTMCGT